MVVLGRSNQIDKEVNAAACANHEVPILRRYGGGGTVVLYPGCLIVSVGTWVKSQYDNDYYFRKLNQSIIDAIHMRQPELALEQKGHSDIVCGQKKIAGTSLFRSRHYLLYQASLIVEMDLEKIESYLKHPSREPDYRKGRGHRDFLSSLSAESNQNETCSQWEEHFQICYPKCLKRCLENEVVEPQWDHIKHLLKRASG